MGSVFATTHWRVVLAAGMADSLQATEALEGLCRTYWYPLYAYVRRRGHSPVDAQDLTQGFFAALLEGNYLARANRERATALKRGGGREIVSWDEHIAEGRLD